MPTGDPCSCCGCMPCRGTWPYPVQPWHPVEVVPYQPYQPTWPAAGTTATITWPPAPARLHPDDIEKIAQRVFELLEKK